MITTSQFQERLIEYLDGELPEAEGREVEEYLRVHPEAAELEGDLALLSAAGRSIRESSYPADLLLDANRSLAARLGGRSDDVASVREAPPVLSGNGSGRVPGPTSAPHRRQRWGPRSIAAALAVAAILLAGAASQRAAIAEVAGSLLERIRVTIDGEPAELTITGLPGEVEEVLQTTGVSGEVAEVLQTMGLPGELAEVLQTDLPGKFREVLEADDVIVVRIRGDESETADSISVTLSKSEPLPAGKMGSESPDVPAQSWGEVKEAIDPRDEASP